MTFWVNLLKTLKITYFCHKKCKNSTLIDHNLRILPVFIWFWCFIKSEIFIWLYQTVNMLIVFRFAYWLKNGITHQNQMKTDIAVKNCDFLGYFTKNGKDSFFLSPKMKKLNRNWKQISELCQFSSDFDVLYHFGIRRQSKW